MLCNEKRYEKRYFCFTLGIFYDLHLKTVLKYIFLRIQESFSRSLMNTIPDVLTFSCNIHTSLGTDFLYEERVLENELISINKNLYLLGTQVSLRYLSLL